MRTLSFMGTAALALVLVHPPAAQAFECGKHFKDAEAAIEKVSDDMKGMHQMMKKAEMAEVNGLLGEAKKLLAEAREHHEKAQRGRDHALAIAKARSAHGYALAADIFHWKIMGQMEMKKKGH